MRMTQMSRTRSWARNTCGVAAIEYALIASLIGCAVLISARTVGANLSAVFVSIVDAPVATPAGPTPNAAHGG